jgi:SAM-dependent methyltransferase
MTSIHPVSEAGFGGDMSIYERGRPSYPADAVAWLVEGLGVHAGRDVADLGAGTGKLTRLLLPTGARVTAVEPSAAMRAQFVRAVPGVRVVDGHATAMPFPDASLDAVTVAQAFHWFDVPAATAELARVLRPRGGVGLLWNERDASVPWVRELNAIFGWDRRERQGVPFTVEVDWREVFERQAHPRLQKLERFVTTYRQRLDADTLVLRVLSTSYLASAAREEQARVEAAVRALVREFPAEFELPYVTMAYRSA